MFRGVARLHPAVIALFAVMLFGFWGQAQAGPITNGPGVAPFVKLGVYQGVISVVPGGIGDSILEIGNAGRDIASTGSLYLRPGTIGGQGGNVVITPQGGPNEGGEIAVQGYGAYQTWNIDVWQNRFRVHTAGQERLVFDGTAGNTYLPTGQLCFGDVGSTNCISGASGPGSTPMLDQVLGAGNSSALSAAVGAAVTPLSKFVVNNGLSLAGNSSDAISSYANTTGSALYAQQNNTTGYAGYFSGATSVAGVLGINTSGTKWGLRFNNTLRRKTTTDIQVCNVGADTCLGKYVGTVGLVDGNPALSRTNTKFCYEGSDGSANNLPQIHCDKVYDTNQVGCPLGYRLITTSAVGTLYHDNPTCQRNPVGAAFVIGDDHPYQTAVSVECVQDVATTKTILSKEASGPTCLAAGGVTNDAHIILPTPFTNYPQVLELR